MYKVHIHVSPVYHYVYEDEHERLYRRVVHSSRTTAGRAVDLLLCITLLLPRLLRFWTSAEEEANGCALEAECLTQLVLQVAFVGEMQRLWVVDEKDESRWVHLRLCRIVDLQYLPTEYGGIMATNGIPYHLIKTRSGNAQVTYIGNAQRGFEQGLYVIARSRRGEYDGRVGNELQAFGEDFAIAFSALDLIVGFGRTPLAFGAALGLSEVPFVDYHNHAFSLLVDFARNVGVLGRQSFAGVDDQQSHVATFDGAAGP